ncbi:MAG: B3/4 domain-containing protein [Bacteroidaceae bacterium]
MKHFIIEDVFREACPQFKGAAIFADIANSKLSQQLWDDINLATQNIRLKYTTEDIKQIDPIKATRALYRTLGKDPSRYRPSAEALLRRLLQSKSLYQINTAADLVNLASMEFGYSIGGFDLDKIQGDTISLGVGKKDEPYEGIGRGILNIENMPVYRDLSGGFGTPTSDHERTKLNTSTTRLLAIVNGHDRNLDNITACANRIVELAKQYCNCQNSEIVTF